MSNVFTRFKKLIPTQPLLVGDVVAIDGTSVVIEEFGGGRVVVRGEAVLGTRVYFRNGVVEGEAPDLPIEAVEE